MIYILFRSRGFLLKMFKNRTGFSKLLLSYLQKISKTISCNKKFKKKILIFVKQKFFFMLHKTSRHRKHENNF